MAALDERLNDLEHAAREGATSICCDECRHDPSGGLWRDSAEAVAALIPVIATVLAPVVAAERAAAWDEGFPAGFEVGSAAAKRLPVPRLTNPYRADAISTSTSTTEGNNS